MASRSIRSAFLVAVTLILAIAAPPSPAVAGTRLLYGLGWGNQSWANQSSTLVLLDPDTGQPRSWPRWVGHRVIGLDYDPVSGTLYATENIYNSPGDSALLSIDPDTFAGTPLCGSLGRRITTLRADPAGVLYGVADNILASPDLVRIDPAACTSTLVGRTGLPAYFGHQAHVFAFDAAGTLFASYRDSLSTSDLTSANRIFTIDTTTGATTQVAEVPPGLIVGTLGGDLDPDTGSLLALTGKADGERVLAAIDPVDGSVDRVLPRPRNLGNIAFGPVDPRTRPQIAWSNPADIPYGTRLGAEQLNAVALSSGSPVPGTFTYLPAAGEVLPVGTKTLEVFFLPDDTSTYSPEMATVSITVLPSGEGEVLYAAAAEGGPSTLLVLDPLGGPPIATIGEVGYHVDGLDYDPVSRKLYASTSGDDPAFPDGLLEIDLKTGAGTPVGRGAGMPIGLIRADSTGKLFGWTSAGDDLVSIDPSTGVATVIGDSGLLSEGFFGMSFDAGDTLYFQDGDGILHTIETTTGKATMVTRSGGEYSGLGFPAWAGQAALGDFNPHTGHYWGIGFRPNSHRIEGLTYDLTVVDFRSDEDQSLFLPQEVEAVAFADFGPTVPAILWSDPAPIVYGTPLDGTQLNAAAQFAGSPVPGTFHYYPPAGTHLPAGARTLKALFVPDDTRTYRSVYAQVGVEVLPRDEAVALLGVLGKDKPEPGGTSTLVAIDPATGGVLRTIGDVGYLLAGLDYDPVSGRLYGFPSIMDTNVFWGVLSIDPETGAGTPIIATDYDNMFFCIRADAEGSLFGWTLYGNSLASIDTATGVSTVVGPSGYATWGDLAMSFDPQTDDLLLVNWNGDIHTADVATGVLSVPLRSLGRAARDGDVNPSTGVFYGIGTLVGSVAQELVLADLGAGTVDRVLPTDPELRALAFVNLADLSLSPAALDENAPSGTVVGDLSTRGGGPEETFTYSLVSGAGDEDNALFTLAGGRLSSAAVFDHETRESLSVRVRSTGSSGLSNEERLTIAVNDVTEYDIRGRVATAARLGLRRVGVTLTMPDGTTLSTRTDRLGRYAFMDLPGHAAYVVKPRKRGWTFTPRATTVTIREADRVVRFTATPR